MGFFQRILEVWPLAIIPVFIILSKIVAFLTPGPPPVSAMEEQRQVLFQTAIDFAESGFMKANSSDYPGAIEDYGQAILLSRDFERSHPKEIAEIYARRGDAKQMLESYEAAISDYDNAIELDSGYVITLETGGSAQPSLIKIPEKYPKKAAAISNISNQLQLSQKISRAYESRAMARFVLYDYSGAVSDFTKVINSDPKRADIYLYLAASKYRMGDVYGAKEYFNQSRNLDPTQPDLEKWQEILENKDVRELSDTDRQSLENCLSSPECVELLKLNDEINAQANST